MQVINLKLDAGGGGEGEGVCGDGGRKGGREKAMSLEQKT